MPRLGVAEALRHCGSVFHRVADVVSTGAVPAEWQSAPAAGDDLLGWYDAAVTRLVAS